MTLGSNVTMKHWLDLSPLNPIQCLPMLGPHPEKKKSLPDQLTDGKRARRRSQRRAPRIAPESAPAGGRGAWPSGRRRCGRPRRDAGPPLREASPGRRQACCGRPPPRRGAWPLPGRRCGRPPLGNLPCWWRLAGAAAVKQLGGGPGTPNTTSPSAACSPPAPRPPA